MLAANPNHSFHVPISRLRASNSRKFKILSNFSPVTCFPPSRKFHISSVLPPNAVHRTPRLRKCRSRSCGSLRSKFHVGACLAAGNNIQSVNASQESFAPFSIKIPVGDRHVSISIRGYLIYSLEFCFTEIG